jgi:two-component system, OmpR family, response regulator
LRTGDIRITTNWPTGTEYMNQDIEMIGYILIVNTDPEMRQSLSGYFSDHNILTSCVSNWSELKYPARLPA